MIINQGGGKENLAEVLTNQDNLIAQIQTSLDDKAGPNVHIAEQAIPLITIDTNGKITASVT